MVRLTRRNKAKRYSKHFASKRASRLMAKMRVQLPLPRQFILLDLHKKSPLHIK
jgi:hypothetical protein